LDLVNTLSGNSADLHIPGMLTRELVNPPREMVRNLDSLPFPARHLFSNHHYKYIFLRNKIITTMITSRGCPYECIFCDKSVLGSQFRARSAQNVLDEIDQITHQFKNVSLILYDDLFTFDRQRVIEICRGILERSLRIDWKCEGRVDRIDEEMLGWMKRAGCSMIAYGVESGNQIGLDYLRKKTRLEQIRNAFKLTRNCGIETMAYFILGIPVETYNDELKTISFAKSLKPDYAQFSVLSPFPGTDLYAGAIASGNYREVDVNNPLDKDLKRPVVLSSNWDEKQLNRIVHQAHRRFYFRLSYILQRLFSLHDFSQVARLLAAGWGILAWLFKPKVKNAC
jgi:anaerobic magnesium-protoporphyrin IX monomethyl ester cyclase